MLSLIKISGFPPIAKLFVAIFTTLMLAVCVWAVWIYTVEKGEVDPQHLPEYLQNETQHSGTSNVVPPAQPEPEKPSTAQEHHKHLRKNLGLAHTHVNGQTLLFFALGSLFIFTSVKHKTKKIVLWTFGISILVHAVGLSGEGFHWFFDDILALSGLVMLLLIAYMCLMIYVDLAKTPSNEDKSTEQITA